MGELEGILNYIAFKAIESTESFSPQLSICFRKGSISVEYYAKIAVFFGVLDRLASQSECFIGLFSFRRAEYDNLGLFDVYFKAHRVTEAEQDVDIVLQGLGT